MAATKKTMNTRELSEAVRVLLENEEARAEAKRLEAIEAKQQRRVEMESAIHGLGRSVEVIKWCIVSITAVMFAAILAMILIAMEVEREAERIKGKVQAIQREAELIRDKIRHPLQTIGGKLGRELEGKIGEAISGDE